MAVEFDLTLIPSVEYRGLSTDTKPTTDVDTGSIYYETDTGKRWQWDGLEWRAISREELSLQLQFRSNSLLEAILEALQGDDE